MEPYMQNDLSAIIANVSKVVVGKEEVLEQLLIALLGSGHILLEDVPGTGKTLLAKTLAKTLDCEVRRIQFTADLLPSDVTGIHFYNQKTGGFELRRGPAFTNVLLADELNRATPRTQSSLLECMEERQVTIDGQTHALETPFLVIATQNPIDNHGTFPLPEAQLDRFMLSVSMGYPSGEEEQAILRRFTAGDPLSQLQPVIGKADIAKLQRQTSSVYVSDELVQYIVNIVTATRRHADIAFGVSPRGSLQLIKASQARAVLRGRDYVIPDDIKALAGPVFAHRIILKDMFRGEGPATRQLLERLLADIEVPTESVGRSK